VNKVPTADRAKLAHREEARSRDRSKSLCDRRSVVVGLVKETRSTTVTTEDECSHRFGIISVATEQCDQVFVRSVGITNMELDCLSNPNKIGDRDTALIVGTHHVADQEVAAIESVLILVDDDSNM
jgi:hypothetical protein